MGIPLHRGRSVVVGLAALSMLIAATTAAQDKPDFSGTWVLADSLSASPDAARKLLAWSSPVAFQLLFALAVTALALFLGVAAYFGAFVAGILAGRLDGVHRRAHEAIKSFSFAVFIPIYFAIVGMQLDLLRHFDVVFFAAFLVYACLAKASSVYAGARLSGLPAAPALSLAVALNARGGPAIVLASVTYAAHIINENFYVSLVMLALVTSTIAGTWLAWAMRRPALMDGLFDGAPEPRSGRVVAATGEGAA